MLFAMISSRHSLQMRLMITAFIVLNDFKFVDGLADFPDVFSYWYTCCPTPVFVGEADRSFVMATFGDGSFSFGAKAPLVPNSIVRSSSGGGVLRASRSE